MINKYICGKTFAVTGGAGFIGSFLIEKLISLGAKKVICIDSFKYGSIKNISQFKNLIIVKKIVLDSKSEKVLTHLFKGVDVVYHLAAEKHNQSKDTPYLVIDRNIGGTLSVMNAAAKNNVKHLIFTSSLYANGNFYSNKMNENDIPIPTTIYGISKLAGENIGRYISETSSLKISVLRYFFVYGPRQYAHTGYKSVIVKNFARLKHNCSPIIFGSGNQKLDYIYIDDCINFSIRILSQTKKFDLVNVGSGKVTKISELVKLMLVIAGKRKKVTNAAADWTENTTRVSDNKKMIRLYKKPLVSLREGLTKTYDWINKNEI
jgi:UDP-glucose 4-epimerase